MAIILATVIILVGLLLGVYIQYVFAAASIVLVILLDYKSTFLLTYGFGIINSLVLLCVPLFIAVGLLMEKSGIGKHLINFVDIFVGRAKAGLAIVAIVASGAFGSISGSAFATLSCIGSIMKPRFKEYGYPDGFTAALVTCSSPLGLLIPPSAHMVLYSFAGRQSMLACFLATVVPGVILMVFMSITCCFLLRNNKDIKVRSKMSFKEFSGMAAKRTSSTLPALFMPVIVLGGIYSGCFTPTEAAAVAVVYTIPVGFFIYRQLTLKNLGEVLIETASTTGVCMVMIFCTMMLARIYIMEDLPLIITDFLQRFAVSKNVILLGVNVLLLIIGMLMDDTSAMLLCAPILIPVLKEFGVDPIQFAGIIGVNLGIALLTPPCAPCLYFGSKVMKMDITSMLPTTLSILIFAYLPTLILTTYVPEVTLWLPRLVLGN
ncbi:MAG: TRAP transporter large permease [Synergistaceae bacterium]|jgi:tripartite ATP-independent transporter DctM subunit|nr:TRAP transporter large permease [Synergistaceae bacterium]